MKKTAKIIQYNFQAVKLEGNVINFDGTGNTDTGELKVVRMYGDVSLYAQAVQDFCIDNNYKIANVKY